MVSDDRGQLILVGAVVVAFAVVGLVLLVNTVLFTETVTNHGATVAMADAEATVYGVRDELPAFVRSFNGDGTRPTPAAARTAFDASVERWGRLLAASSARPAVVALSVRGTPDVSDSVVHDEASRRFTNRSGASNWTLVDEPNATTVRRFRLTVNRSSLADTPGDAFRVNVTNATPGHYWTLVVYRDGGGVRLERRGSSVSTASCTVPASDGNVTLNVTAGSTGSGDCGFEPFAFAAGVAPGYAVAFERGANATGTYRLVFDDVGVAPGAFNATANAPYRSVVVTNATVSVSYVTPRLTYRANATARVYR